jgi:hypothetical protein
MFVMGSKWGVELEGDLDDLANLAEKVRNSVQTPADFFVVRLNQLFVLRTKRWDEAADARAFFDQSASYPAAAK